MRLTYGEDWMRPDYVPPGPRCAAPATPGRRSTGFARPTGR